MDVREPGEWSTGHLPGARLVPLAELRSNPKQALQRDGVIFVCAAGVRSQTAARLAAQLGFSAPIRAPHRFRVTTAGRPRPAPVVVRDVRGRYGFDADGALWIATSAALVKLAHADTLAGDASPAAAVVLGQAAFPDLASKVMIRPTSPGLPVYSP